MDLKNLNQQSPRQKKLFLESCSPDLMRFWQNKIIEMKRLNNEEQRREETSERHDRVQRSRKYQKLFSTRQNLRVSLDSSAID
jgi:hypothetical protein